MIKSKKVFSWNLSDLIKPYLLSQMDKKWFGVRKHFNRESALFLPKIKEFKNDIKSLRQEFEVPPLKQSEDLILIKNLDHEREDSLWLGGHTNEFIDRWEKRIKQVLDKHRLPDSFRDWVEFNILYGEKNSYPNYNVELFTEMIKNPDSVNRIGLTTGEKNYLLSLAKFVIRSTKGKRKSSLLKSYKTIEEKIAESKNKMRRMRTFDTALKTLRMGTKANFDNIAVGLKGDNATHKFTSEDLATRIFNDETGKKAALVRKQKERLLKRHI